MRMLLNGVYQVMCINDGTCFSGVVPGDVVNDLHKAGLIDDPYYGENFKKFDNIKQSDYRYQRDFEITSEMLAHDKVRLVFEGIDTFASIFINGKQIAKADSMHLLFQFDVKNFLHIGKNTLAVELHSVLKEKERFENQKYLSIFDEKRIFIRKAQCHFGWDWAPNFPGYGIYRDVYLEFCSHDRIENVHVLPSLDGTVKFRVELEENTTKLCDKIVFSLAQKPNTSTCIFAKTEQKAHDRQYIANLKINKPKLWWPNGYGEQNLYEYRIELFAKDELIDWKCGKVAIKEVKLCEDAIDEKSQNFAFVINGKHIFCRGGNWVPANSMTGCITKEHYQKLIEHAKFANFNMLRVWGGGIYESDCFYDFCDQNGIMIWQDFMFACSDVIDDDDRFVQTYVKEAIHQVKRLRNHACITYFCGGNEKTGAFNYHYEQYGNYFLDIVLRGICNLHAPNVPFGRISPTSLTDIDNHETSGDCHTNICDVALEQNDIAHFYKYFERTKNNFSSECAFQGCCRYKSLTKFIPPEKLPIDDEIYVERFFSNPYTNVMPSFIERQIEYGSKLFGKPSDTKDFVKKSSMAQAEFATCEIDYARTNGRCNGLLSWMYNDIWPIGTWAVIDYYLTPKPAFYAMKRSFENERLCFVRTTDLKLCFISDYSNKAKLTFGKKNYDGKIIWQKQKTIKFDKLYSEDIKLENNQNEYYFAHLDYGDKKFSTTFDNNRYDCKKYNDEFSFEILKCNRQKNEYVTTIQVSAKKYSRCVFIDCKKDYELYSDNYFELEPNSNKIVTIRTVEKIKQSNITICGLYDVWHN